jgi:hypothetical protein
LRGRNQSRTYALDDLLRRVTCVIGHRHRRQKNGSFKKVEELSEAGATSLNHAALIESHLVRAVASLRQSRHTELSLRFGFD